jgi:hypothetical protein
VRFNSVLPGRSKPASVSLLIPTYARVSWLEEALFCALHQDYAGRLEILICNDCSRQRLVCNVPSVKIINISTFDTLGAKRNFMISAAAGEFITWLDDDDLVLPWYVTRLSNPLSRLDIEAVVSHRCYGMREDFWTIATAPIETLCRRENALRSGGFPVCAGSGEDQAFRTRIKNLYKSETIVDEPGGYVYRWGQGTHHISGDPGDIAANGFRLDAVRRMEEGSEPVGSVILIPRLRRNYFRHAPDAVMQGLSESFRRISSR